MQEKNKKIAYIFYGQVKNYEQRQHDTFTNYIERPLLKNGFDVDYFLVTTDSKRYSRGSFDSRTNLGEGSTTIDYKSICNFFDFNDVILDGLEDESSEINQHINSFSNYIVEEFGEPWGPHSINSVCNSFKQLYSLEYFISKFTSLHEYDFFILSRCDLFHTHYLDLRAPLRKRKEKKDIFMPSFGWYRKGCNDRFAFFNHPDSLAKYCSRYSEINERPEFYHAENYLLLYLKRYGFNARHLNSFRFRFIRANGLITNEDGYKIDYELTNSK